MRFPALIIIFTFFQMHAQAQTCTGPGRTPQTAFAVCDNIVFTQPNLPNCTGSTIPFAQCQGGLTSSNSVWYRFQCYQAGNFGFLITPLSLSDDYDWAIMDITGRNPNDVFTTDLSISVNISGSAGITGCTIDGTISVNCAAGVRINEFAGLQAGHEYLLMVNNFSQSGLGYNLSINGGDAVLSDQLPPALMEVTTVGCNASQLRVKFTEDILCSSITSTGSEFSIINGSHPITGIVSGCTTGYNAVKELIINLQNPIPEGSYNLVINNGADGNTLTDVCGTAIPAASSINFSVGPQTALAIDTVLFNNCAPNMLTVVLTKPVLCSSITPTGSEFSFSPAMPAITAVQTRCNPGRLNADTLQLIFQGPLAFSNYQMQINNGTDANSFIDTCTVSLLPGYTYPFTVSQNATAPAYDSVQFSKCAPSTLKVFYSRPLACSSISPDGSDFSITGPLPVNISSVTTAPTCSNGYTNWVTLNLSQPLNINGSFTLRNVVGADGNSVTDTCAVSQDISDSINFEVFYKPAASFEDTVYYGCVTDTILLSHPGGNGINFWQWTFSDGTVLTGPSVAHQVPATTPAITVQLLVSNGICPDTLSRTYILGNAFTVDFDINADSLCQTKNLIISNKSIGNNLQYSWNFGDGTTFNGQNPPPHQYATAGDYMIALTVQNNLGCTIDSIKNVHITESPVVLFANLASQYCTIDTIRLAATISGGNVSSYTWNNGNGVFISNEPVVRFVYPAEGNYTISLTATDRFCGSTVYSRPAPVFQQPVVDLGNDLRLCRDFVREIGIATTSGYSYQWNNGATTSKITTGPASFNYRLAVNNNNCITEDTLLVTIQDTCLLRVPGAFTPNNDGLNDYLKVINAELAKNFSLRIYNRFGQLVYASTVPTQGWNGLINGLPADPGTYVWQVSYINPYSGLPVYDRGTSILIR